MKNINFGNVELNFTAESRRPKTEVTVKKR